MGSRSSYRFWTSYDLKVDNNQVKSSQSNNQDP
jgi:hypothetical protein